MVASLQSVCLDQTEYGVRDKDENYKKLTTFRDSKEKAYACKAAHPCAKFNDYSRALAKRHAPRQALFLT